MDRQKNPNFPKGSTVSDVRMYIKEIMNHPTPDVVLARLFKIGI